MISPPLFWYDTKTTGAKAWGVALAPFGWIYGWCVRKRFDLYFPIPLSEPVICVGNLVAGGAGKTPAVLALVDLLAEEGLNPHVLTRGYGGSESGPTQVSPGRDQARDVGDEALLLVEKAPTWVAVNRPLGAQAAIDTGATVIVMDDGFQNPVIYKDAAFVVVDGAVGFGNRHVMPAGPLREPIRFGLSRADAAVIVGEDRAGAGEILRKHRPDMPVFSARLVPEAEDLAALRSKKLFAFAGIGRPEKFKETLMAEGLEVEGWAAFPDHYPYEEDDLAEIMKAAEEFGGVLVTTAKDHVRLSKSLAAKIFQLRVRLVFDRPEEVVALIRRALEKRMI